MAKLSPEFPNAKTVAATVGIAAFCAAMSSLSHPAALTVDGQSTISDVPPVTTAKGAYVPLRAVADSLGAETNYDAKTGKIELIRADDTLRLRVGDETATLNGKTLPLKPAPFSVRGRTMVPLNVIARAFKTQVRYDKARARIDVMTAGTIEAGADQPAP